MIKDGSALNSRDTFTKNANQIDDGNSEDFGKFEFQTESLLSLVQPELLSLSQYWLAALRDHALLSLPPGTAILSYFSFHLFLEIYICITCNPFFFLEFSSQLPHDGGAFYTTDTMESARPHYADSWAPILHAATLWLNAKGFGLEVSKNDAKATNATNNNNNDNNNDVSSKMNTNVERFHLLFGKYYLRRLDPASTF